MTSVIRNPVAISNPLVALTTTAPGKRWGETKPKLRRIDWAGTTMMTMDASEMTLWRLAETRRVSGKATPGTRGDCLVELSNAASSRVRATSVTERPWVAICDATTTPHAPVPTTAIFVEPTCATSDLIGVLNVATSCTVQLPRQVPAWTMHPDPSDPPNLQSTRLDVIDPDA